jgi:hypothetical protein
MERWLPIALFEGSYEVSDRGRVRSLDRQVGVRRLQGVMLRPARIKTGHLVVVSATRAQPNVRLAAARADCI